MVFVKGVGLNFYRRVVSRVIGVHVKNQVNSLLKSHFSRPLKNPIFGFSGTSPGFSLKNQFFRYDLYPMPKTFLTGLFRYLRAETVKKPVLWVLDQFWGQ